MGKLLIYYLDDTNFQRTDTNKDGMLNESELAYRMGQAIVYRLESDEKELKKLEQEYPYFSDAKVKIPQATSGIGRKTHGKSGMEPHPPRSGSQNYF